MYILLTFLIQLTGPNGQIISVNPMTVVSVRTVRSGDHFAPGIKCIIHTTDGHTINVVEECGIVKKKLEE